MLLFLDSLFIVIFIIKKKIMALAFKIFLVFLQVNLLIVVNGTMIITQPANTPFPNNTIEYSYANFGDIQYGKSESYDLVHVDNNLCQTSQLKHFNTSVYVLTDDTGSCSYTQKARTVQALGAKGLIIGSQIFNYYNKIVPSSDLNGRKVHIAVLFVSKSTYKSLFNMQNVQIKVNYTIVQKQKSQVVLYLQSASRLTYIFLREFKPYFDKLGSKINLQLIYSTVACTFCDPNDCILSQKYCAFDLQNYNYGVGANIVKQQLRQYDIYSKYGSEKWFQYMNLFDQSCDFSWNYAATCSEQIQKQIGIKEDLATVNMENVMKSWKEKQTNYSFISPPQIAINGILHPGNLQGQIVYESICSSLVDGCTQSEDSKPQPLSITFIILAILIGALIILTIGFCIYKRFISKELTNDMSSKANELVAKYASKVSEMKKKRKSRLIQKNNDEL